MFYFLVTSDDSSEKCLHSFLCAAMIESQARCGQGLSFLLSGWCGVRVLVFQAMASLVVLFVLFLFQCIGVTELNAKRAPCCAVVLRPPHSSPDHGHASYLILEMTFPSSPSQRAIYVSHPASPSANNNVNGLEFPIDFGVRGALSLTLPSRILFTTVEKT